jgi:hypothetical protein
MERPAYAYLLHINKIWVRSVKIGVNIREIKIQNYIKMSIHKILLFYIPFFLYVVSN